MMVKTTLKEVYIGILVIILICATWFFVMQLYKDSLYEEQLKLHESIFNNSVNALELVINKTITNIYGLRGFVYSQIDEGITDDEFYKFAEESQKQGTAIKNFSLAPNNIQEFVYPLVGNETTIGHNLNIDSRENVRNDVQKAEESGQVVLSGPYVLRQGGLGLVVRNPIYYEGDYWGIVNVVIDIDYIIEESKISTKSNQVIYSIKNDNNKLIYGEEEDFVDASMYQDIELFNNKLHVAGKIKDPKNSIYSTNWSFFIIISLSLALALALLVLNSLYRNILLSEKVNKLIYNDSLTGLPNRRALEKDLNQKIKKNMIFGLAYIDLDNFKHINDTLGHSNGDYVLKIVSERFMDYMGKTIDIYRWGGDEFIVTMSNITDHDALLEVARNMKSSIEESITILSEEYIISFCAGISLYPDDGKTVDDLIKNADLTMYHSKDSGKNRIEKFSSEVGKQIHREFEINHELDKALDNDVLEIYYQPQVNLENDKIIGVEALVRWRDEQGNFVPPNLFIPIAEKSGLIARLDKYVINQAISQVALWNSKGINLRMSVNISASQFNENVLEFVKEKLEKHGVDFSQLEIEITESATIKNIDQAQHLINAYRQLGIGVALDDFGTGHSSLSYLSKLSITTIKIDQSFISKIVGNSLETKIVKTIIMLARELNLDVVAEGVEEIEQKDILKSMGCDLYQGYFYSKAIPAIAIEQLYRQ